MLSSSIYLLIVNSAILMGCAVFISGFCFWCITALLFFLPLLDQEWFFSNKNIFSRSFKNQFYIWSIIGFSFLVLLFLNENYEIVMLNIILLVALPEEWFFRAYFLQRLEVIINNKWVANAVTSFLFALLHLPTQGIIGLAVFIPSLAFGYIFQRSENLLLVVMLHVLSNLVYLLYLRVFLDYI